MDFKHRYNQCCNPMKLEKHRVRKGLRPASIQLQQSWDLSNSDYLCTWCRKRMLSLKPLASSSSNVNERCHVNETSFDSSDDDMENEVRSEFSISSQLSLGTQLPVVNQALSLLNISPIDAYSINKPSYLKGRYDDICSTFAKLLGLQDKCNNCENLLNSKGILNNLKQKFNDKGTTRDQKIQILTLLPVDWSINQICDIMGATKHMAVASKYLTEKKGVMSAPEGKKGRVLSDDIKNNVLEFYKSDDVSVNLPGKKDFLSVRNDDGQRQHIQKRLILCNLKELYQTFKEQYPDYCVGFSSFASLRPIHCVLAGSSGTHTICVCAIHQNIKLMMLGSNLAALTHDQTVPLLHYSDCFKLVLCPYPSSDCYFGKCAECPGIDVLQNFLCTLFDENVVEKITYKYWISKPRSSLETLIKSSTEFVDLFCPHIINLLTHDFIAKEQSTFMKLTKESLTDGEVVVICDFAENYAFVIQNAAPGFHCNNNQATIFPVVMYYKKNNKLTHQSLVIISDGNNHDAIAVHLYLRIITNFIKEQISNAAKIFYFSDGAPQQFKNFKNFVNIYFHKEDFGIDAEWHYFATAHGKGPCDGIGGTLKRIASRVSLQRQNNEQITTAQKLYEWASNPSSLPNITVQFSPERHYFDAKEKLDLRYGTAKSVPGTQKMHSIIPTDSGTIIAKEYSRSNNNSVYQIFKKNK